MTTLNPRKRSRSPSPHTGRKSTRTFGDESRHGGSQTTDPAVKVRKEQESFAREQTKRNQIQENEQMREWVSKEDEFVLMQAKKKAQIRVREGRAKPIDWLAIILSVIDPTKDLLDDVEPDSELDVTDPDGVIEDLNEQELRDLEKDIESYLILESNVANRAYWKVRESLYPVCYMLTLLVDEDYLSGSPNSNAPFHTSRRRCELRSYRCRSSPRAQVTGAAHYSGKTNKSEASFERAY
jgi:hypothetical protein